MSPRPSLGGMRLGEGRSARDRIHEASAPPRASLRPSIGRELEADALHSSACNDGRPAVGVVGEQEVHVREATRG